MEPDRRAAAHAILASSRALVGLAAQSLEQSSAEVTLSQWRALVLVHTRGGQGMSALAYELGLSPSSTSRLVERLERKGLARRTRSPLSRREVELELTVEGVDLVVAVLEHRLDQIDELLAGMDPTLWPQLDAAFTLFARAAGESIDPVVP